MQGYYTKMVDALLEAERGLMLALNDAYKVDERATGDDWKVGIQQNLLDNSVPEIGPMNLKGVDRSVGVSASGMRDGSVDEQLEECETKLGSLHAAPKSFVANLKESLSEKAKFSRATESLWNTREEFSFAKKEFEIQVQTLKGTLSAHQNSSFLNYWS
ncbi:hypothetical protein L7F22_033060 [Adiantum nelumboides]|nr:hypothetical protein [Adiantum nelumboides]